MEDKEATAHPYLEGNTEFKAHCALQAVHPWGDGERKVGPCPSSDSFSGSWRGWWRTLKGWQDTWDKSKAMNPLLTCSSQSRWGRTNWGFFSLGWSRVLWHRQLKPSESKDDYFMCLSISGAAGKDSSLPQTSFSLCTFWAFPGKGDGWGLAG